MAREVRENPTVHYVMEINKKNIERRRVWPTLSKVVERSSKMRNKKLSIVFVYIKAIGGLSEYCSVE